MPEDAIASASISCPWLLESDPLIPDKLIAFANTSMEFGSSLLFTLQKVEFFDKVICINCF